LISATYVLMVLLYNVSRSVGRHGRNLETDVQLVKWMLNDLIIYLMPPTTNKAISSDPVPDTLGWTGVCTPETKAAILWFQKSQIGARDATINSADDWLYGPPGHQQFYTIRRARLPARPQLSNGPAASADRACLCARSNARRTSAAPPLPQLCGPLLVHPGAGLRWA